MPLYCTVRIVALSIGTKHCNHIFLFKVAVLAVNIQGYRDRKLEYTPHVTWAAGELTYCTESSLLDSYTHVMGFRRTTASCCPWIP